MKTQIIETAKAIISDTGIEGISMRNIASALDVSATALYRHYKNKDAIIIQICKDGLENMIGNMQSIDFKKLSHNLTKLTSNLDNSIQQADVKGLSKDMKSSLITLKDTALQYQTVAKNINQLFSNKELKGTLSNIASITKQLKSTGSEAQRSLKLLNKTLNNTNALIREYKAHANQILSNTESMTENMRAFSETAKQYPRQILFGSPPPHIDPSKL